MTCAQFELGEVGNQNKGLKQIRNNMLRVLCRQLKLPVQKNAYARAAASCASATPIVVAALQLTPPRQRYKFSVPEIFGKAHVKRRQGLYRFGQAADFASNMSF